MNYLRAFKDTNMSNLTLDISPFVKAPFTADRSEILVRPDFRCTETTVPKFQYGSKNPCKRKEISVRCGCSTFHRADYKQNSKKYWNGFFYSFLSTGEIFIFEVCGNIRPAKVLRPS